MSEIKKKRDTQKTVLQYTLVGASIFAFFFILMSFIPMLFSFLQLGVFILLFVIITASFNHLWKLEEQSKEADEKEALLKAQEEGLIEAIEVEEESEDMRYQYDDNTVMKRTITPQRRFQIYKDKVYPYLYLFIVIIAAVAEYMLFKYAKHSAEAHINDLVMGVISIAFSFVLVIATSFFNNYKELDRPNEYMIVSYYLKVIRIMALVSGISGVLCYFGSWQLQKILTYAWGVVIIIAILEIGVQCAIWLIDGKESGLFNLKIFVFPAIFRGGNPIENILQELEDKAGISLRSSWTLNFIKRNISLLLLFIVMMFWLSTSLVQINPHQQALIYRLGSLKRGVVLDPGLHIKLPWPIEVIKTYNTQSINNFTVGFETKGANDFLWTSTHSNGEEYKLLMGDGKELISIDIKIFYKINDLLKYATNFALAENHLKSEAYAALTKYIVTSNLDTLLTQDRENLSGVIATHLRDVCSGDNLGIEVANVEIDNVHPPVEVVDVYQNVVSANIDKNTMILNATTYADSSIPVAEQEKNTAINAAVINATQRKADAHSEATLYNYKWSAYNINPKTYKETKWLYAFAQAVADKPLYLIDARIKDDSIMMDLRGSQQTIIQQPVYQEPEPLNPSDGAEKELTLSDVLAIPK